MLMLAALFAVQAGDVRDAADVFVDACVRGEVKFSPTEAALSTLSAMPEAARKLRTSSPKIKSDYVRFVQPADTWLIVEQYDPAKSKGVESVCTVVSSSIDYTVAMPRIHALLTSSEPETNVPKKRMYYRTFVPQYRYSVESWRLGRKLIAMRTTLLSPKQAAKELEIQQAESTKRQMRLKKQDRN